MEPGGLGNRRRIAFFLLSVGVFTAGASLFGAVVGYTVYPQTRIAGAVYGALGAALQGFVISAAVVGGEVFLPRTSLGRAIHRAPLLATVLIKTLAYSAVIIAVVGSKIGRWLAAYVVFGPEVASAQFGPGRLPVQVSMAVAFLIMLVTVLLVQVSALVGVGTWRNLLLGRYHRPRIEERFFLFVDIVGSTPLAERLGPASVHDFLNRVFEIASQPIDDHAGEVYQYVGDEVVVSWTVAEGRPAARPIACLFAIRRALEQAAPEFERRFGGPPRLRAALHAGPVTTGEVGGSRRAIVYHGDVVNTTSRLENATRDLGHAFLVSQDALDRLEGLGKYKLADLGERAMRGRSAPVRVYAVEGGTVD